MSQENGSIADSVWGFIGITLVCAITSGLFAIVMFFITFGPWANPASVAKYSFITSFAILMVLQFFAPKVLASVIAFFGHILGRLNGNW